MTERFGPEKKRFRVDYPSAVRIMDQLTRGEFSKMIDQAVGDDETQEEQ